MNRNKEYQALLEELARTPEGLEGTVQRAQARQRKSRRRRGVLAIPAASLAACFAAFVLLVNLSVPFARACGSVPLLRELARAVAWSPSLSAAVENNYVQPIGQSQTANGITATIEYVIVDQKQVNIFFTLEGDYGNLNAEMPKLAPEQKCSLIGSEFNQPPGTLLNFTLDYRDGDVPDSLTMTFGVYTEPEITGEVLADEPVGRADSVLQLPEWEEPDILAEFTFTLEFDPSFTAQGEQIPVNQTFLLGGQTLTVTEVEVYPTHVRVNVAGDAANTAWLKDLDFYLENEDGERFEPISNGVSATGDEDTPANVSFRLESAYFAHSDHLTLHITGAVWLDKDRERIPVDLAGGTAEWLPEGVSLQSMIHLGEDWVLTFDVTDPQFVGRQVFQSRYFDEAGTEYDMNHYSWSYLDDDRAEVYVPLHGYDQDTVLLEPLYSHATPAEPPVTIPLK